MAASHPIKRVCVYAASSRQGDQAYTETARRLGRNLAERDITIVYGGGAVGSMGALADGALQAGGSVVGVLPQFMHELEWGHTALTQLHIVDDLHQRKRLMLRGVDAVVALPGGSGTIEELMEALTWKRLGLYLNPIILVNVRDYFQPLIDQLERAILERFMDQRHRAMWSLVEAADQVLPAIEDAPSWTADALRFASL